MVTIDFGLLGTILSVAGVIVGAIVAVVKVIQRLTAVEHRLDDIASTYKVLCKSRQYVLCLSYVGIADILFICSCQEINAALFIQIRI